MIWFTIDPQRMSMDVGVDNIYELFGEYRPINLDEVINFLPRKTRETEDNDDQKEEIPHLSI